MIKELTKKGVVINIDGWQREYVNNLTDHAALITEQPPEIVVEVMIVWGDTPTIPDYEPEATVEPTPAMQITTLKVQLTNTDYQIIKCSECQLVGQPMPYDVPVLHAERQTLRDQINELELSI